jgi:PHO85 cyclin-5
MCRVPLLDSLLRLLLLDSSTQIVEAIWPTSSVVCRSESGSGVLPLRTFIQETLRRSRTSYSTLQVALYYLVLVRPHVPSHDFTMEQLDDSHASRALQCGRRMFLAALILASKYLQDRNYSARAWSKISGLHTQEINQNEMAFLLAVNWKLHISEEVYNRWTECVMKHKPSQPPSPGGAAQLYFERQCEDFKEVILKLNPELDNLDEISPWAPCTARRRVVDDAASPSPRFLSPTATERTHFGCDGDITPTPKNLCTPAVMDPYLGPANTPGRLAPALGLLPTPRLTPHLTGLNTPAASVASHFLGKPSAAMGLAFHHASTSQGLERWPVSSTPPLPTHFTSRRSSLANSVSAASSPESMISDTSRTSRSSSTSSASSLTTAPFVKLDVQARCRSAKLCGEKYGLKPRIASVPEDFGETYRSESPDSYTGPVGKHFYGLSLDSAASQKREDDDDATDSVHDAALALQELHKYARDLSQAAPAARAGSKRRRQPSLDQHLHDDVRGMLSDNLASGEKEWPSTFVRSRGNALESTPANAISRDVRKRVCCAAEAVEPFSVSPLHPLMGGRAGPGMWEGMLN